MHDAAHARDEALWRGFTRRCVAVALSLLLACFAFVALVDPHDHLPLSLPFERAPINTNQRFSYPALARSARFDSAIIGTSTARLLRPSALDRLLDARFVNLSMNSATAHEQWRILELFLRHHPHPKQVVIGLDAPWCALAQDWQRFTFREFPQWMYDDDRLNDYLHLLNGPALEQAARQVEYWLGRREPRYGRDGYRNFLPPDAEYDLERARGHLYGPDGVRERAVPATPAQVSPAERASWVMPGMTLLARVLDSLPERTTVTLMFVPYHLFQQAAPGTREAVRWDECRRRVTALAAARPGTRALDFMIPSPVTREDRNYWDPLHFTTAVAAQVERSLARAIREPGYRDATFRWLHAP